MVNSSDVDECYLKFLERNYRNLNIAHLEVFCNFNPILEKTKRIFDQNGVKGLLLNNLDIDNSLSMRITMATATPTSIETEEQNHYLADFEEIEPLQGWNLFKKINSLCRRMDDDA